jgi:uncharacterized membrane protein
MDFLIGIFTILVIYYFLKEKYDDKYYALPGCMALLEMLFWVILPIVVLIVLVVIFTS